MGVVALAVVAIAAGLLLYRARGNVREARAAYIDSYPFPSKLGRAVRQRYPDLSEHQVQLVLRGLREYFHICNRAGKRMVAMPSQAVDVAWHELILHTALYARFCRKSLGRFLHHTPAEAMQAPTLAQIGIRRAWKLACARESIDPKRPAQLPLLFAIDGLLGIPDGFRYHLDCQRAAYDGYCAGHIGCSGSGGCVSDSGADGASAGGGDGCSSGCGGGD